MEPETKGLTFHWGGTVEAFMRQPRIPNVGNWLEMNKGELSYPILHQFLNSFSTSEIGPSDYMGPVESPVCDRFPDKTTPATQTDSLEDDTMLSSTQTSSYYPPSSMGSRYSL